MAAPEDNGYASFEDKWLRANPEQAVVAVFLPPAERRIAGAFGSLVHELEHTLLGVREPQAAAAKLEWWRHELAAAAAGGARHPVSRELCDAATDRAARAAWPALPEGAAALLDAAAPASLDEAFERLAAFYRPVVAAEAALLGTGASDANVDLWISSQLMRATRELQRHADRALALPLDLLARHGLTRAELARPGAGRDALLADFLGQLGARLRRSLGEARDASLGRRVRARIDLDAAAAAARNSDPARFLAQSAPGRWRVVWIAWHEARARARRPARA